MKCKAYIFSNDQFPILRTHFTLDAEKNILRGIVDGVQALEVQWGVDDTVLSYSDNRGNWFDKVTFHGSNCPYDAIKLELEYDYVTNKHNGKMVKTGNSYIDFHTPTLNQHKIRAFKQYVIVIFADVVRTHQFHLSEEQLASNSTIRYYTPTSLKTHLKRQSILNR